MPITTVKQKLPNNLTTGELTGAKALATPKSAGAEATQRRTTMLFRTRYRATSRPSSAGVPGGKRIIRRIARLPMKSPVVM
jgi:hypothetical protein